MVQVHVPQGVGVRVPPWAPSTEFDSNVSSTAKRRIPFNRFAAFCISPALCFALSFPILFPVSIVLDMAARRFMLRTMKRLSLFLAGCTLAAVSAQLVAGPAPYYKWTSRLDSQTVCSQTPLGPGWVAGDGPYSDSRCMKRIGAR
jgi:hypothetical protein